MTTPTDPLDLTHGRARELVADGFDWERAWGQAWLEHRIKDLTWPVHWGNDLRVLIYGDFDAPDKDVEIPEGMQRAMAKAAESERGRRARIIAAEGELQAAEKLSEAARIISHEEGGLQLRFLQTASDMASSSKGATTILLPIPIDLISWLRKARDGK